MNLKGKCAWVTSPFKVHPQTFYCKSTDYVMEDDPETGRKMRVYRIYCPEHQILVDRDESV